MTAGLVGGWIAGREGLVGIGFSVHLLLWGAALSPPSLLGAIPLAMFSAQVWWHAVRLARVLSALSAAAAAAAALDENGAGVSHGEEKQAERQCHWRAMQLMAALELHQMTKGHYPGRLQDVAGVAKTDLQDPFSGQTFVYRKTGQSYMLYSAGPDGKGNGGKGSQLHKSWERSPDRDLGLWRPLPPSRWRLMQLAQGNAYANDAGTDLVLWGGQ